MDFHLFPLVPRASDHGGHSIRRLPGQAQTWQASGSSRALQQHLARRTIQIIDIIETYREMASDLTETYMSSVSNRMNEIMKVLTIIGTIFIPLTFLAGVYGMNFHYFPELEQAWAYPAFWGVCAILAGIMFAVFRRRKWM